MPDKSYQFRISLSDSVMQKLDKLCEQKGLGRSAIIALAIDLLRQEEENRIK